MSVLWDCAVTVVIIPREHSAVPVPPAWNSPLEEDPVEIKTNVPQATAAANMFV